MLSDYNSYYNVTQMFKTLINVFYINTYLNVNIFYLFSNKLYDMSLRNDMILIYENGNPSLAM